MNKTLHDFSEKLLNTILNVDYFEAYSTSIGTRSDEGVELIDVEFLFGERAKLELTFSEDDVLNIVNLNENRIEIEDYYCRQSYVMEFEPV